MSSSIFTQTTGLQAGVDGSPDSIQSGTVIKANVDGQITHFRWYNFSSWSATESWTFFIWGTSAQGKLVQQTYSYTGLGTGYQTVALTTPLSVTAGQTFIASVFRSSGKYTFGSGGELSSAISSPDGNLTALADGTVPTSFDNNTANGRYDYFDSASRPTSSFNGGAYFVDVVFEPATAATPHGSATGSVSFTGSASGHKAPHGSTTGTVAFTGTATGHKNPHGAVTGSLNFTGTATGHKVSRGSATGSVAFTGTAAGTAPTVGAKHGAATGAVTFTGSATGHTDQHGSVTGAVSFIGSVTGHVEKHGSATGSVTFTGSASGTTPAGIPHGRATGSVTFSGSVNGHTDHHGSAGGSVAFIGAVSGHVDKHGSSTGSVSFTGAATGHAPTVGLRHGSATGSVNFTGSASGHKVSRGSATGAVSFTGSAAGHVDHHGSATGTVTFTGSAAGTFSKGFPDLTVIAAVMAGWSAAALTSWGAFVDMEEPINAKSPREYLRVQLTLPNDISVDVMVGATVQVSVDGGALQAATLLPGNIVYLATGSETATPLAVGNHVADIYVTTADEKPVVTVGFTVV